MNKKQCPVSGLFALVPMALAVIGAVLLTLVIDSDYNFVIRHFNAGTGKLVLAFLPLLLSVPLAVFAGIRTKTAPYPEKIGFSGAFPTFAAALFAFLLLACCVFDFITADAVAATTAAAQTSHYVTLLRIRAIISVISAPYFVLIVLGRVNSESPAARFAPLPFVVWAVITTICQYFDGRMPINDPIKSFVMMLTVGLIAVSIAENRLVLRRGTYALVAALLTVAVTLGGIALATLFASVRAGFSDAPNAFGFGVMEASLYTAAFLFAAARLSSLGASEEQAPEAENE